MKNETKTTIRLPVDLRTWLEARAFVTYQSLNMTVVKLLSEQMDSDPLTKLRIKERNSRYIVASAVSQEKFRAFNRKDMAIDFARTALEITGADSSNVIDQTGKQETE